MELEKYSGAFTELKQGLCAMAANSVQNKINQCITETVRDSLLSVCSAKKAKASDTQANNVAGKKCHQDCDHCGQRGRDWLS